jgi:hypothetical protein
MLIATRAAARERVSACAARRLLRLRLTAAACRRSVLHWRVWGVMWLACEKAER